LDRNELPRAPENSLPFTIEGLEGPLELIPSELSLERLETYRPPNNAVFINSSVDVGRVALKPRLAQHHLAVNGKIKNSSPALPAD
jgi:hypothetical protein